MVTRYIFPPSRGVDKHAAWEVVMARSHPQDVCTVTSLMCTAAALCSHFSKLLGHHAAH